MTEKAYGTQSCYAKLGRQEEARAEGEEVVRLKPDFSTADFLCGDVLLEKPEDREQLREGLLASGLPP